MQWIPARYGNLATVNQTVTNNAHATPYAYVHTNCARTHTHAHADKRHMHARVVAKHLPKKLLQQINE